MTETFFDWLNGSIRGLPVNVLIICAEAPGIMAIGDAVPGPKPAQTARKGGIAAFEALRDAATPLAHPGVGEAVEEAVPACLASLCLYDGMVHDFDRNPPPSSGKGAPPRAQLLANPHGYAPQPPGKPAMAGHHIF